MGWRGTRNRARGSAAFKVLLALAAAAAIIVVGVGAVRHGRQCLALADKESKQAAYLQNMGVYYWKSNPDLSAEMMRRAKAHEQYAEELRGAAWKPWQKVPRPPSAHKAK